MRIFLTGAVGFIGSHLAAELAKDHEVYGLVTPFIATETYYKNLLSDAGIEQITGDLRDRHSLDMALRRAQPDIVLHLAALTSVAESFKVPYAYLETNVLGSCNLVNAVLSYGQVKKFVHTSTPEMLKPRKKPYTENDLVFGHNSPYGVSKVGVHKYIKHCIEARGFPACIALPNNVFHRKTSRRYIVEKIVTGILKGKLNLWGKPEDAAVRNFTYIDDVVGGFKAVIERGKIGETYFLCNESYWSLPMLVEIAKKVINPQVEVNWDVGTGRPYDPKWLVLAPKWTYERLKWEPKVGIKEGIKRVAKFWENKLS